jgi:hypothetical protein
MEGFKVSRHHVSYLFVKRNPLLMIAAHV